MNNRRSSRRAFLSGKSAVDALTDLQKAKLEEPDYVKRSALHPPAGEARGPSGVHNEAPSSDADSASPPEASAYEALESRRVSRGAITLDVSRPAMACNFTVFLNGGEYDDGVEHAASALDEIERLEGQLTVYRDHSEVSRLNRAAASQPVAVQQNLFDLLMQAITHWQETDAAFDITSGPLSKIWGFYRRQGNVPSEADLETAMASVGSQYLELDSAKQTVSFDKQGVEINLGGIGKGYAVDEAARVLLMAGVEHFCFHGGHSSVLARGGQLVGQERLPGWNIGIRHPQRPQLQLGEFWLVDAAMGTSGTATQSFFHKGRRYGHIIDPRTGWPVDGVLSTTVIAPCAADADALATAFYVLGLEKTLAYCESRPEVSAILLIAGKKSGSAQVHTANLTAETWNQPPGQLICHF